MQSVKKTCALLFNYILKEIKQDKRHKVVHVKRNVIEKSSGWACLGQEEQRYKYLNYTDNEAYNAAQYLYETEFLSHDLVQDIFQLV